MKNFLLSVVVAAFAVPSSAQVRVAPPSAGATAWVGPLAGAVKEMGLGGIAGLESSSLSRLTAPGTDGRLTFVAAPQLLNPLVETLEASGVDPIQFPDLPLEFKMTILRTAATLTEERLNMKVWEVVGNTHKGIGRSAIQAISGEARKARETSLYLNDRTMEGLIILETRVKQFHAARAEATREFLEDLPKKISAGAFDGKTLLRTEDDGGRVLWTMAGDSPERAYATPEAALDARLDALALMPPGPWSLAESKLLMAAMDHLMGNGTISPSRWTVRVHNILLATEKAGLEAVRASLLARSASRIESGKATAADVLAVERFYAKSYDRAGRVWPVEAKILAAIHAGGSGLPSWERLQAARLAISKRISRLDLAAARLMLGGMLLILLSAAGVPVAGPLALIVTATGAMLLMVVQFRVSWFENKNDERLSDDLRAGFRR